LDWKVVVHAESPSAEALETLGELTGLNRGELLRALRRGTLIAGSGYGRDRAASLAKSLREDFGLEATALPAPGDSDAGSGEDARTLFRVVLTGYRPGRRARLRDALQRLSGLPPEQVVIWLSRIPFVLRDRTDHDTARKIRRAITEAGGMIDMRPVMDRSPKRTPRRKRREPEEQEEPSGEAEEPSAPPPTPPRPPISSAAEAVRSSPPPRISFIPPEPSADLMPPPVVPEAAAGGSTAPPPRIRFLKPPSGFAPPPVAGVREVSDPPPAISFSSPPEASMQLPPEPATRFRLLLHRPSRCSRSSVEDALRSLLSMSGEEMADLLGDYPAWVASFRDRERADTVARSLEMRGATVSVLREGELPPVLSASGGESFRKWIGADG
jgi:hypothetical protein